jgi:hypothetical protein
MKKDKQRKMIGFDGTSYKTIKDYCDKFGYKISKWSQKVLLDEIQKNEKENIS